MQILFAIHKEKFGLHRKILKFTILVKDNSLSDGKGALQKPRSSYEGGLLTNKKKRCLCKRYTFIGNISFVKQSILIISISIDVMKDFEDVF